MITAAWLWGVCEGCVGAGNEMWVFFSERITSVDAAVTATRDRYIQSLLPSVVGVALCYICKGATRLR